jgi:hypothetical protein
MLNSTAKLPKILQVLKYENSPTGFFLTRKATMANRATPIVTPNPTDKPKNERCTEPALHERARILRAPRYCNAHGAPRYMCKLVNRAN